MGLMHASSIVPLAFQVLLRQLVLVVHPRWFVGIRVLLLLAASASFFVLPVRLH